MKVDEKKINKETNKVEICTEIVYEKDGIILHREDNDTRLLRTTLGQCGHTDDVHYLLYFRENFEKRLKEQLPKDTIKIRYAYLGSPTNLQTDPAYHETLKFKVLTIAELELRPNRIGFEELITDGNEALIEVLGRDRCTGRVDMGGNDIYENDRIRCYADSGGYMDGIVDQKTLWISTSCEEDCEVIGTTYDKAGD